MKLVDVKGIFTKAVVALVKDESSSALESMGSHRGDPFCITCAAVGSVAERNGLVDQDLYVAMEDDAMERFSAVLSHIGHELHTASSTVYTKKNPVLKGRTASTLTRLANMDIEERELFQLTSGRTGFLPCDSSSKGTFGKVVVTDEPTVANVLDMRSVCSDDELSWVMDGLLFYDMEHRSMCKNGKTGFKWSTAYKDLLPGSEKFLRISKARTGWGGRYIGSLEHDRIEIPDISDFFV